MGAKQLVLLVKTEKGLVRGSGFLRGFRSLFRAALCLFGVLAAVGARRHAAQALVCLREDGGRAVAQLLGHHVHLFPGGEQLFRFGNAQLVDEAAQRLAGLLLELVAED